MKKKAISLLLVIVMVLALLPTFTVPALAATYSGTTSTGLSWALDTGTGVFEIGGVGEIPQYNGDTQSTGRAPWFFYRDSIQQVIIANGVTAIGTNTFNNCVNLTYVSIPNTVATIGAAFSNCTSLESIVIPDSVTSLSGTFYGCTNLSSVELSNSLEQIGSQSTFRDCTSLKQIILPESLREIGNYSFQDCTSLESIVIPGAVESIGGRAFSGCTNLKSVKIGSLNDNYTNTEIAIVDYAFSGCSGLTDLILGSSVKSIDGRYAFYGCSDLKNVYLTKSTTFLAFYTFFGCSSLTDVYYTGTVQDKQVISVASSGNSAFVDATWHYSYVGAGNEGNSGDSDEPGDPSVVGFYPANGSISFGTADTTNQYVGFDQLSIVFDRKIAKTSPSDYVAQLDYSAGTIGIYRATDDALIWESTPGMYTPDFDYSLTLNSAQTALIIKPANNHMLLDFDTEYYVVMDEGFLQFVNGSTSPGIAKGKWVFETRPLFWIGHDNNSYSHSSGVNGGFEGVVDYSLNGAYYNEYVRQAQSSGNISNIKTILKKEWGGSCYGIATTMALVWNGVLKISDIATANADNYYSLPRPRDDSKLLNTITLYQISQNFSSGGKLESAISRTSKFDASGVSLEVFLKDLINYCKTNPVAVFGYNYENTGHAIVTRGYEYDSVNNLHLIKLYDENGFTSTEMKIASDYSNFSFTDGNGKLIDNDTYKIMYILDSNKIYNINRAMRASRTLTADTMVKIVIPYNLPISIENSNGEIVNYDGDSFSGNLDVHVVDTMDFDSLDGASVGSYVLYVNPSNSYTLSGNQNISAKIYDNDDFLQVNAMGASSVEMKLGAGINLSGANYTFEAFMSTDNFVAENEKGLVSVAASAEADVIITKSGYGLDLNTQGHMANMHAKAYEGVDSRNVATTQTSSGAYVVNATLSSTPTGNIPPSAVVTIKNTEGGRATIDKPNPKSGETVTITTVPDYGYELESIMIKDAAGKAVEYIDKGNGTYTFTMSDGAVTISAMFKLIEPETITLPFTDVRESDWFYEDVLYAYANNLFNGTSATTFSPNTPMSRAMAVTVLYRLAGSQSVSGAAAFSDVPSGDWYSDAVAWAASLGVVNGVGDGEFSPNGNITRQDLAVILARYADIFGIELPQIRDASDFADADEISGYAADAVRELYTSGIVNGKGDGVFDPKGNATRAEVAAMLHRFAEATK